MNTTTSTEFNSRQHLNILKTLVITANALVLFLFLFLHIIFYDIPFVIGEELPAVAKMAGIASLVAAGISFIILLADGVPYLVRNKKTIRVTNMFPVSES